MSIPISLFLFLYLAFLAVWLIFSLVGVFHMMKFGFKTFTTFFTTFSYIVVAFLILFVSYDLISQFDWRTEITVFQGFFSHNSTFIGY